MLPSLWLGGNAPPKTTISTTRCSFCPTFRVFSTLFNLLFALYIYSFSALCVSMSALIAVRVRSGRSGQALTTSTKSGNSCTKLSKPVSKTGFSFSVSALFVVLCEFDPRGSTPLGGSFLTAKNVVFSPSWPFLYSTTIASLDGCRTLDNRFHLILTRKKRILFLKSYHQDKSWE